MLTFALLLLAFQGPAEVVINEIMYHPQSEDVREEYIELFNTGPLPVSVAGWQFTSGVQFTIPDGQVLAAGGVLVICADPATFTAKHPGAGNVVGGWTGILSNSGQDIELVNDAGLRMDHVHYADDGDWALRRRGDLEYGHRGWAWSSEADGLGDKSLELINPWLTNNSGQNWAPSRIAGGTPGAANSTATNNVAPLILGARHSPDVPRSNQAITFTARLVDESATGLAVILNYRIDGAASFQSQPLLDDGLGADNQPGDLEFTTQLPAQPNQSILEFYFTASDAGGRARTWPTPARDLADQPVQVNNALLQVDDTDFAGPQPLYLIVMKAADGAELYQINRNAPTAPEPQPAPLNDQTRSHARFNATFISRDGTSADICYLAGIRNRGNGSRTSLPQSYNLAFTRDDRWKRQVSLNLNAQNSPYQVAGAAVMQHAGLAVADSRAVQMRLNGENLTTSGAPSYGFYVANEVVNSEFADHHFPLDSSGNLYRGIRLDTQGGANLRHQGSLPGPYRTNYFKESNTSEDDWSDLIQLTDVLTNTPPASYAAAVESVADVDQWLRYFAVNTIIDNNETSLANGDGDDYFLYSGVTDPRFRLIPYDLDTILGFGTQTVSNGLFRMTAVPALNRFIKHPEFAPRYYAELVGQLDGTFASTPFNSLLDQVLGGLVTQGLIDGMKEFVADRADFIRSQIPTLLSVTNDLAIVNGYFRTTAASVSLRGRANVIDTRRVLVNGSEAEWSGWDGRWTNAAVALQPGLNRVVIQSLNSNAVAFAEANVDIWRDTGATTAVAGTLTANTVWSPADGPYRVTSTLTVPAGVTLTIQPGTTVYFAAGAGLTVSGTGRLLAEGTTTQRIRLTREPAAAGTWLNLQFLDTMTESRLVHVDLEYAGNSRCVRALNAIILLDDVRFANSAVQYVTLDDSSFIIRNCVFPTTAGVELIHGLGLPTTGHGIFEGNFFGGTTGLNDIIDFTGGKRPNAILQILNNVFSAGSDDCLDLDGTDAHVEGNIFMHTHQTVSVVDSSSAVSGGANAGVPSHVVIARNWFHDVDHLALAKENNFYTLINNTALKLRWAGVLFDEPGRRSEGVTPGRGAYLDGNVIWDAPANFENAYVNDPLWGTLDVTVNRSILPASDLINNGVGNLHLDPRLAGMNGVLYANLTNLFQLRAGSPASGTGPNCADMGAAVPPGVTLAGEPYGTTWKTSATLTVGGAGYVSPGLPDLINYYRYRVNDGAWSNPVEISQPIALTGLPNGTYTVFAIGQNSAGVWQGTDAPTASRTWTVNPNSGGLRLNEVLAGNTGVLENAGTFPDALELFNNSGQPIDLGDLSLTDNPASSRKYVFPPNTLLAAESYLTIYADNNLAKPGLHTGFSLKQDGDDLYLFNKLAAGGGLIDSIVFGPQLVNQSIGRRSDGAWGLTQPTFGTANQAARTGETARLRINEWLADARLLAGADFVELFNPDSLPVDLGGLHLSDNPIAAPKLHAIAPLSFIPVGGYRVFIADGDPLQGALHLNFRLAAEQGLLGLADTAGQLIDTVFYGPQRTDVAQGRSPSGGDAFTFFLQPTPGAANPGTAASVSFTTLPLLSITNEWRYQREGVDLGTAWREPGFNDAGWLDGRAIFYGTNLTSAPNGNTNTFVSFTTPRQRTFYFRAPFVFSNTTAGVSLGLKSLVDDGGVYYLNGVELLRENLPAGGIAYTNLAIANINSASFNGPIIVPANALLTGTNWLAVEVHQATTTSTDMAMGVELTATFAVTNTLAMPVVLNEVLADNRSFTNAAGRAVDYVELFNPGASEVTLANRSLSDDSLLPRKFVFPTDAVISPGGFRLVLFDSDQPASATNSGFGLNRLGDAVMLFDAPANGGGLLDSVVFGPQIPDFAIGRDLDGAWRLSSPSPGAANLATVLGDPSQLKINEWLAAPAEGADWFELFNPAAQPIALGDLRLTDNLLAASAHVMAPLSFIGTGREAWLKLIADSNPGSGADHVGFNLAAAGESIGVFTSGGQLINGITFGTQVIGVAQGRLPDGGAMIASFTTTPSPGAANFLPLPDLWINEVLTHTDPPLADAIELFNPTPGPVAIGGWWLSNDGNQPQKFQLPPDAAVQPAGFQALVESQFNGPEAAIPFALNSAHGDEVFLSQTNGAGGLTGYRVWAGFGAAANGVSFGRFQTSLGPDLPPQSRRTLGAANAYPLVSPVVIDEVMFQPPAGVGNDGSAFEYIEFFNRADSAVKLFDEYHATNTWHLRGGVDFDFPMGVTVPAGDRLLLVNFNPMTSLDQLAAFRAHYGLAESVSIRGPYSGTLGNLRVTLRVERPDAPQTAPHPDAGFVPYLEAEQLVYQSTAPWPAGAGGSGLALQRLVAGSYANEPLNWTAARASPGAPGAIDTDADGLLDNWEQHYFNAVNDPRASPELDPDGDQLTNLQEWLSGTNPVDPNSFLRVSGVPNAAGGVRFAFFAVAGKSYSIVYRADAAAGSWLKLLDIPAQANDATISVLVPAPENVATRVFRLVTPSAP